MKILIALAFMLAILAPSINAQFSGINIELVSQSPFPAEPGDNVEIEVQLQNIGYGEASGVSIEIDPKQPFELLPGEEKVKKLNIAGSSSIKQSYKLHVSETALTNDYNVNFRIIFEGGSFREENIPVKVQGKANLFIKHVSLEPDHADAGGLIDMNVEIENVGTGKARGLTLQINSTPEIKPTLAGSTIYMGDLEANTSVTRTIRLAIDSSAEEKTYILKAAANYDDESGTGKTTSFDIGIPVSGNVQLDIIKIQPDYARRVIEVEIANKGTADASSIEAQLFVNGRLVDVDYVSQLKTTKKTTLNFPLIYGGIGTIEMSYTGPGLEHNNVTKQVMLDFAPDGSQSNPMGLVAIIIILAGAGYYFRKRIKALLRLPHTK